MRKHQHCRLIDSVWFAFYNSDLDEWVRKAVPDPESISDIAPEDVRDNVLEIIIQDRDKYIGYDRNATLSLDPTEPGYQPIKDAITSAMVWLLKYESRRGRRLGARSRQLMEYAFELDETELDNGENNNDAMEESTANFDETGLYDEGDGADALEETAANFSETGLDNEEDNDDATEESTANFDKTGLDDEGDDDDAPEETAANVNLNTEKGSRTLEDRIKRYNSKKEVLEDVQFPSMEIPNIGFVDCRAVLDCLVSRVQEDYPRYKELFHDKDATERTKAILEENLISHVRELCHSGQLGIENIQALCHSCPDPTTLEGVGVYLHVLRSKDRPNTFWMYVGQSIQLKDRMSFHHKKRRDPRSFGLHYYVWNTAEEKDPFFITLYKDDMVDRQHQHLLLNVAEMWLCCIMQTLPASYLNKYLPENVKRPWAGCHLNVAFPLWQSSNPLPEGQHQGPGGRDTFKSYLQPADPDVRTWAENNRNAFNQLRNSPDLQLRSYYEEHVRIRLEHARGPSIARQGEKATERMREFLEGKTVPVGVATANKGKASEGPMYGFNIGQFNFSISQLFGLNLQHKERATIQFCLAERVHPHKYAVNALKTEPASRLAVLPSVGQENFHAWLINKGSSVVWRMDSLVDILEGYTLEERKTFGRRFFFCDTEVEGAVQKGRSTYT